MIDESTYLLSDENYIKMETIKTQIVLAHSSDFDMRHFIKWENRMNGRYTKTAAYSIDFSGKIYRHFDPIYTSTFFADNDQNKKSIVILLENEGWLIKDPENNQFINWVGHIYSRNEKVIEKNWRGFLYWAPYTREQVESVLKLTGELCNEFYIPRIAMGHNTKETDMLAEYKGILYRSNLEKHYTDLSPAFDFLYFKDKLENDEE